MQKGTISVQTENIFPIIKQFLYSDQEIFLRELVSNAVDATNKLRALSSKGQIKGELGDLTIEILLDTDKKTLTIRDKGIGLTAEEAEKYLNQVAFSSAAEFLEKYKDEVNIIGHFGLGFYSAFMVASKVEVFSKSWQEGAQGILWTCEGDPSYTIDVSDKQERGTDVVLHISEDASEYLQESRVEQLLKTYCKFLPIPIQFGTKTLTRHEGDGDDKKEIKEEVPNIINNTSPLWKKQPSEIKDEEYLSFYQELYPYSPEPMFWIHLNIDYPFNLTGILYFPKLGNSVEIQKNKIQLYSNQVYVTDNVKDIVPEFLTLLHGVIDSPDIPLNVSRSSLQADSQVKKITGYITRKVSEKLHDLFKKDRSAFESKWKDIGVFVKYGMISEDKFYEKATSFALLKDLEGKYYTLEECENLIKENQKDKYDKLVAIYCTEPDSQYAAIEAVKQKGYHILHMDTMLDNHFMQHLEYRDSRFTFVRVDSDTPEHLVQKEEKTESVLSESEQEKVKKSFESGIEDKMSYVTLKALSPEEGPVLVTRPEFMRRMKEMQMMQGAGSFDFPDSYHLVVNTNHPLIAQKLVNLEDAEREALAKYLSQLALMQQGMLKGKAMADFVKNSLERLQ